MNSGRPGSLLHGIKADAHHVLDARLQACASLERRNRLEGAQHSRGHTNRRNRFEHLVGTLPQSQPRLALNTTLLHGPPVHTPAPPDGTA